MRGRSAFFRVGSILLVFTLVVALAVFVLWFSLPKPITSAEGLRDADRYSSDIFVRDCALEGDQVFNHLVNLKHIDLVECHIGEGCGDSIAKLESGLKTLSLRKCYIADRRFFTDIAASHIDVLEVVDCNPVSKEDIATLQESKSIRLLAVYRDGQLDVIVDRSSRSLK